MKRSADPRSGTSSVSTLKFNHLVNYSISHTSCETKSFWAMGYFSLGKCAALAAVVAGSRRRCGMERAVHTGVDWKVPPVSAPHRDMELKVPTKPGRRAMALHDPVQPETKPVVLFPGGLFKPSFSIQSRNAWTPGLRLESAAVMRQRRAGASTCRSNRGTSAPRSISRSITLECPIAVPMPSTAAATTML